MREIDETSSAGEGIFGSAQTTGGGLFGSASTPGTQTGGIFGATAGSGVPPAPTAADNTAESPVTASSTATVEDGGNETLSHDKEQKQSGSPLDSALVQQDAMSLFEQPPVFSFEGTEEEVTDLNMTFEELRVAKSSDFPGLGDYSKVSWEVVYGKTRKPIATPKTSKIGAIKKEIEMSKKFLDEVKESSGKKLRCLLKATARHQSKGQLASYKGVFSTIEEARASDKTICLVPGSNGKLFELRKTGLGEFITRAGPNRDLGEIRAGFHPALPRVPFALMEQIVSFFKVMMAADEQYRCLEALVNIYWDTYEEKYVLHVPKQVVTHTTVDTDLSDAPDHERYLHFADIHSHNDMPAFFSMQDDKDEQENRVYIVVGALDDVYPTVRARICNGGQFLDVPVNSVVESSPAHDFDLTWLDQVSFREQASEFSLPFPLGGLDDEVL